MPDLVLAVQDQLAIQGLYARQAHAIDGGDAAAWAATFTADGRFRSPTYDGAPEGTEQLRAFATAFRRAAERAGVVRRHWTGALNLRPVDADTVEARCYALVLAVEPGSAPLPERSVVFHDRLRRTADGWRVADRRVEVDGA